MDDDFWKDAEIIHVYSRAQAIEDGTLVDVSDTAKEAGFRIPAAVTRGVWADCVVWPEGLPATQDEKGRLWDVVWMARCAAVQSRGKSQTPFQLLRVPREDPEAEAQPTTLNLHIGPGDSGEPVLTIMLPEED